MKLQQLKFLSVVAESGFNLSAAAKILHTSQPGISKQLKLLEEEMGTDLLVRRRGRIVGLTGDGSEAVTVSRRMLQDADILRTIARGRGALTRSLVLATTHVHARYVLLDVIKRFKTDFPRVRVSIKQGTPDQIVQWVDSGEADFGLSTAPSARKGELIALPCFFLQRSVLVAQGHPLSKARGKLTLAQVARYPIISLDKAFAAGVSIGEVFERHGLTVDVVLTATDADVIKAYVASGLGIAIPPSIAFDPKRDSGMKALPASHLFPASLSYLWFHRNYHLPQHVAEFVELLSPRWKKEKLIGALHAGVPPGVDMALELTAPAAPRSRLSK